MPSLQTKALVVTPISGDNFRIMNVNVRAIGKECTLTGKELLPGIFVAFVSPKLKYLIS